MISVEEFARLAPKMPDFYARLREFAETPQDAIVMCLLTIAFLIDSNTDNDRRRMEAVQLFARLLKVKTLKVDLVETPESVH